MSEGLMRLAACAKSIHSQYGEDGIIEEALRRISAAVPLDNWCVEFGAWDGVFLSNTCNLIRNKGYKAVLIESDRTKFAELCRNLPSDDVIKICNLVGFDGPDRLDALLAATPVPEDFDFLSIDVDGCDYHVFDSVREYRPKLVCIEYNHTIPNEVEFTQPKSFSISQGTAPKSLVGLARSKGYELVAATTSNLFFVRAELKAAVIGDAGNELEDLRDDREARNFIFCGFDGTVFLSRPLAMPWHGLMLDSGNLQQLPRALRRFPPNYTAFQRSLFDIFLFMRFPGLFRTKLLRRLFGA